MTFALAPWRSPLARAIHRNKSQPHHRFFQLATVTPEGKPRNRTVVFRGFLDQSNDFKIITDQRSEKMQHLTGDRLGEIAWYFTKTREQFRLSGKITAITAADHDSPFYVERTQTWQSLSDAAREQFFWPTPAAQRSEDLADFQPSGVDCLEPGPNFVLLLFQVTAVDHLELRGNPQNRFLYHLDGDRLWQKKTVNP
ncbi:Npun_F5749 family FMN-dependent PPOX-type flavoprotein [Picosynechococcus sp. NKBG15041c]|uniref:Npun_F5749 family FMN-dependent PPOX-type flavoprotein n=1 Tax=Picosynechococcus sp. NKBG15041c TaxID=1407650 RepID=UPI000466F34C|nr:Npun_F5749 family FMN-dependent PPOX-type flavoprotein [Picosynechococcus sp. NKBG15041c]